MKSNIKLSIDQLGICASALCIVHCIAVPFLLIFGMETLLQWTTSDAIKLILTGISILIGLGAFISGYRKHKQHFIPVLFISGILLIINGESVTQEWLHISLSVGGAAIIIYAHFNNLLLKRHAA